MAQEMPERANEVARTRDGAVLDGRTHLVHDDITDLLGAVFAAKQLGSKRGGNDVGHVLMLADRPNLLGAQVAEAKAVFQCYHETLQLSVL